MWEAAVIGRKLREKKKADNRQLHIPQRNPLSRLAEKQSGCVDVQNIWTFTSTLQGAVTLKMNLFINTVVYLEMCRKGINKKSNGRKIKINKKNVSHTGK